MLNRIREHGEAVLGQVQQRQVAETPNLGGDATEIIATSSVP
jgi:hypothetical protein